MPKSIKPHKKHIDKALQRRLYLYFGIAVILIAILIGNVARGALRLDLGILGLLAGIGIGIIASRMFHTSWNTDTEKVVSRLDAFGICVLVFYILFEVFRERIVGFFTHNIQVGTVGFAVLAGVMFGRVLGTRGKIMVVLKEQKIIT